MRSAVAQRAKEEHRREMLALTVAERVELARRLGEEGIVLLMAAEQIDREEAIRRIERSHRRGRRPSVLNEE